MQFHIDNMLNKLAKWLRFFGLDTLIVEYPLTNAIRWYHAVLITSSIGHYLNWPYENKYYLNENILNDQLIKLIKKFELQSKIEPFSRCCECNSILQKVEKEKIHPLLPSNVAKNFNDFNFCNHCKKIFWQGSHYDKIYSVIKEKALE